MYQFWIQPYLPAQSVQYWSLHRHVSDAYRFDRFGRGYGKFFRLSKPSTVTIGIRTADAVRRNMIHFHADPEDIFVILSGDQLYRMDFSKMVEEHLERGADVTWLQSQSL